MCACQPLSGPDGVGRGAGRHADAHLTRRGMTRRSARQARHDPGSRERPRVAALPVQERRAMGVDCARTVLITAVLWWDRTGRGSLSLALLEKRKKQCIPSGGWRVSS